MKISPSLCLGLMAGTALSLMGCTDFDLEEIFEDTRILGVRTEPPEIFFSPLYLTPPEQRPPFPLPSVDVDVEVFAFDRRGGRTTLSIQMCPEGAGDSSCRLYDKDADEDFARLQEPARGEVAALLAPAAYEDEISADATPVGRVGPSSFRYTLTPAAIDFFQPKDSNGQNVPSLFPINPRFAIQVENQTQKDDGAAVFKERGFKRLPLSLDLTDPTLPLSFLQDLARNVGISLCDGPIPEPVDVDDDGVDDVFIEGEAPCLHPRVPNVNPALIGFRLESTKVPDELTQGTLEGVPDLGLGSLVRASPGAQIALTPMWAEGAVERYQVVSFDIEASQLVVLNRIEDMACSWYASRGSLNSGLSSLQFSDERLGNVWTLPSDAKSGERDSLVLVVLDQRGGTTVGEVTVEYR